ncbi:hypothetical protein D3C71_1758010 [compost metagenome]
MHHAVGFEGAEHRQVFQVLGPVNVTPLQECRTGHHEHLCLTQPARDQQRVFVARFTYAQSHVDTFGHQIDAPVDQHHLQLHLRVLLQEVADHLRQHFVSQSDGR